jgi:hypothetical protein
LPGLRFALALASSDLDLRTFPFFPFDCDTDELSFASFVASPPTLLEVVPAVAVAASVAVAVVDAAGLASVIEEDFFEFVLVFAFEDAAAPGEFPFVMAFVFALIALALLLLLLLLLVLLLDVLEFELLAIILCLALL